MNLLFKSLSTPFFQPFAEMLLRISLKIMNIGDGQSVDTSGEKNVINYINKEVKENPVVIFDVGAHTGEWLRMCKEHIQKKYKIFSFEPSPLAFVELNKNKSENIICEQIGFGEVQGTFYMQKETDGESTSQISDNKSDSSVAVTIETIDSYCEKNSINKIHLLKLDVEGYELKILDGAKNMLASGLIDMIQFEFGAPSNESYSLNEFFEKLQSKYSIHRILQNGLSPIENKHYFEIHTVTNFLAIRKI